MRDGVGKWDGMREGVEAQQPVVHTTFQVILTYVPGSCSGWG